MDGDRADGFYTLLKGRVRIYKSNLEGREVTIHIIKPGARREMKYAAPVLENYLKRISPRNKVIERRHAIAERVLGVC